MPVRFRAAESLPRWTDRRPPFLTPIPTYRVVPETSGDTPRGQQPTSRFRRAAIIILPMAVGFGGLVFLITSASDVASIQRSVAHIALPWVAVAVCMEIMSFFWLSVHLRVLAGAPANATRAAPIRLALVVFGLGPVLPAAPAEGLVLAGSASKRRRMDRRRIAVLLGFSQWFSVRGVAVPDLGQFASRA